MSRGALVVIEGLDRSGKLTQARGLAQRLGATLVTFPDRSTPVGEIINRYLKKEVHLPDETIHLLFSANRWELKSRVETLLQSGPVVMDRYVYSGIAYSLAKGSLGQSWLYGPDRGLPKPDLTVFLTVSPAELAGRGGFGSERYEVQLFQEDVRRSFAQVFETHPAETVDVTGLSIDAVAARLWALVQLRGLDQPTAQPLLHFA